jgi:putative transposase
MKDQKKAEEIAAQRMQLLSPLLAEGLDNARARQIKARICEESGISERTLRRYLTQYRREGFSGLKPKGKRGCRTSEAIPPEILEQAILLRRQVPSRSLSSGMAIIPGTTKEVAL